jgi:hypothetical protein
MKIAIIVNILIIILVIAGLFWFMRGSSSSQQILDFQNQITKTFQG